MSGRAEARLTEDHYGRRRRSHDGARLPGGRRAWRGHLLRIGRETIPREMVQTLLDAYDALGAALQNINRLLVAHGLMPAPVSELEAPRPEQAHAEAGKRQTPRKPRRSRQAADKPQSETVKLA